MRVQWFLAVLLAASGSFAIAETVSNVWISIAQMDLRGIHDILQENHPGPVDPRNPEYRKWLEGGLALALQKADSAACFSDYVRALEFYTNGFRDGHIGIGLNIAPVEQRWPGFIVNGNSNGEVEVVYSEQDSGVPLGATLNSCDGASVDQLFQQRIDPYFWNAAIPHQRFREASRLFYLDTVDTMPRFKACRFSAGEVNLKWRRIGAHDLQSILDQQISSQHREPGVRYLHGVWLLTIPTFAYSTPSELKSVQVFLHQVTKQRDLLRKSKVVFDVRGNHGGDSAWARKIAGALYGDEWIDLVAGQFDFTVDWRASASNLQFTNAMIEREQKAGLADAANDLIHVRDAMEAAIKAGNPFARVDDPPHSSTTPPPSSPITGQVFLLTDGVCASACLDFADIVRRLPNVTHVGLPTSADAIYIDNTYQDLPSGIAGLGYSMKVFRNRVRKNNEWYEPDVRWPGGVMSDDSVTRWIATLTKNAGPRRPKTTKARKNEGLSH